MDLEKLTKHQIILLTLLVSFVTSIATGIVTVSLLDQAPKSVTQTINRVVERTVEKVVSQPAVVIKKDPPIMIKQDDVIASAVEKSIRSIVRVYAMFEGKQTDFLGFGAIVSSDGKIITDSALVEKGVTYSIVLYPNHIVTAKVFAEDVNKGVAVLELILPEKDAPTLVPSSLNQSDSTLRLGQTVIVLGGKEETNVSTGIIARLLKWRGDPEDATASTTSQVAVRLEAIEASVSASVVTIGSPLINTEGEIIGIRSSADNVAGRDVFTPGSAFTELLSQKTASSTEKTK